MNQAVEAIFQILVLIFSVVIHEVSHGTVAYALGDSTAKDEGRLTLNPLKHLDPFGSVVLPLITYFAGGFVFGWARPVPYNPMNLRSKKWFGFRPEALVGIAGPASNVAVALIFGLLLRFSSALALPTAFLQIAFYITFLNIVLAVFNLVPLPPLDGSKVLFALLPPRLSHIQNTLEQYGIFLLLLFIFFFSWILLPVAAGIFRLITGAYI